MGAVNKPPAALFASRSSTAPHEAAALELVLVLVLVLELVLASRLVAPAERTEGPTRVVAHDDRGRVRVHGHAPFRAPVRVRLAARSLVAAAAATATAVPTAVRLDEARDAQTRRAGRCRSGWTVRRR
jgi:hypothetical protein